MAIGIRPATGTDAEDLARLGAEFGYPSTVEGTVSRLASLLSNDDQVVWIAEDEVGALGWLNARINRQLESPPYGEIVGLVVTATRRSQGIGAALVAKAEDWAKEHGLDTIRVRSRIERNRAHGFYQQLNYVLLKTQCCFAKSL